MTVMVPPRVQFPDAPNGYVYTYEAGTSTPLETYPTEADVVANTNANTNPVQLDANGAANIFFRNDSKYKVDVRDLNDVSLTGYPIDNFSLSIFAATYNPSQSAVYVNATTYRYENIDRTSELSVNQVVRLDGPNPRNANIVSFSFATHTDVVVENIYDDNIAPASLDAGMISASTSIDAADIPMNRAVSTVSTSAIAATIAPNPGRYISLDGSLWEAVTTGGPFTSDGPNGSAGTIVAYLTDNTKCWRRIVVDGAITIDNFGAVADSTESVAGTDNSTAIQAALDSGYKVIVPEPQSGFGYGLNQVSLPRNAYIQGPCQYTLALIGLTTTAAIVGGGISDLQREVTIKDLYIHNPFGGDAVDLEYCPDFNFTRVYFRSSGVSAGRGLNLKNCERGHFSGQCRFGGNPALRLVKDCNSVSADRLILSGGELGLALDISGCQQLVMPVTIETSLQGIRLGDKTGDNAVNGGWTSGVDLSGSYLESVGTPVVAGEGFAVSGVNLDNCWLNNAALADTLPFPVSAEILRLGRVRDLTLTGGRWVGAGTETALKALDYVVTSGNAPGQIVGLDVDLTVFESVAALCDTSAITNASRLADSSAQNRVKTDVLGRGLGSEFEWISPQLTANILYGTMQLTDNIVGGGRITSVELVEGDGGLLTGARIRLGSSSLLTDILDKTFGAVAPIYEDQAVTDGFFRPADNLRFRLDAGTGIGTFRIKIKGVIDGR